MELTLDAVCGSCGKEVVVKLELGWYEMGGLHFSSRTKEGNDRCCSDAKVHLPTPQPPQEEE